MTDVEELLQRLREAAWKYLEALFRVWWLAESVPATDHGRRVAGAARRGDPQHGWCLMYAGTLGRLQNAVDAELETTFAEGGTLPGLDVERTQHSFDNRPIQAGQAATRVETTTQDVSVGVNAEGEPLAIDTERRETMEDIVTDWVADVTGTGLVAAASVTGDGEFAFPFDLFTAVTDERIDRLEVNVLELHEAWDEDDTAGDVWMTAGDDGEGANIAYHSAASRDDQPTIGIGFERPWNGTVERGVVFESGYVAVYSASSASSFIRFVEEELLPFCEVAGEDESEQQTLDDAESGEQTCEECGVTSDSVAEIDGRPLCIVHRDAEERGTA